MTRLTMGIGSLLSTLLLPFIGTIALLLIPRDQIKALRSSALVLSLLTFCASIPLFFAFDRTNSGFQFLIDVPWVPSLDVGLRLGLDGMSLLLVLLTTFIMPIAIYSSFEAIQKREKEYYAMLLFLQFAMTGTFMAMDTFVFYVFWEMILIPMYFLIGIWGGQDRVYAAVKFFLYTVVGSLLMLIAIVWLGYYAQVHAGGFTTSFVKLQTIAPTIPSELSRWMFLAFALSFCIKVPLFPFHTWLPDAHVQAPTAGSVILAGILLKLGTYGLIRFNLDLFPEASRYFAPLICTLAVIGIIYGALVAMVQTDVKKLVAYSSVSHLGFVVLGIFSMTEEGVQGAIIQMANHGLSTGMLFLCVGVIYERRHTREIAEFGGITNVMPRFAVLFAIAMFASVGLPGLNGFVGEFLTLVGAFRSAVLNNWTYAVVSSTGVIFAAVYLLWMFQRVMFGTNDNPKNQSLSDVNAREMWTLVPLVVFIVWIGVYPKTFMELSAASTNVLVEKVMGQRPLTLESHSTK